MKKIDKFLLLYDDMFGNPAFTNTNESLEAILVGMDPKENEHILSICGSGTQPKLLARHSKSVVAVDNCYSQICYARGSMFPWKNNNKNINYRLGNILSKKFMKNKKFDSIYVSNALTYSLDIKHMYDEIDEDDVVSKVKFIDENMNNLLDKLKSGGRMYLSNELSIIRDFKKKAGMIQKTRSFLIVDGCFESYVKKDEVPSLTFLDKVELDFISTKKAQRYERDCTDWHGNRFDPVVLIKK